MRAYRFATSGTGIANGASDLNAGKLVGCPRLARICSLP